MANIFDKINSFTSGLSSKATAGQKYPTTTPVVNRSVESPAVLAQRKATTPVLSKKVEDGFSMRDANRTNISASPSATSAVPTTPTTPASSSLPPAGQAFINNQISSQTTTQQPTTPSVTRTKEPKPEPTAKDKYLEYLNSSQVKQAGQNVTDLSKLTAEEIARTRTERDVIEKNDIGALESGVNTRLNDLARKSSRSLADLAIAKGYATEIYQQMIDIGATTYEAEKAAEDSITEGNQPINLNGELYQKQADGSYKSVAGNKKLETQIVDVGGQKVLIDSQTGQTIKTLGSSGSGASGISGANGAPLSALAQAVQNGTIAIDKLPAADRARVAAELASSGVQTSRQQALASSLEAVDALLNNPNMSKISGYLEGKLKLGSLKPDAQLALNQFEQIKGILSLENREKLKGSGAISDFEFRVLSQAASALGRNLNDADFKAQLEKIRDVFEGKYASTEAKTSEDSEEAQLLMMGYTPEQIALIKSS